MNFAVGLKIGKLTLVEFVGRNKHSKKQWLCKCECGNMCIRIEGNLKTTKVPHCGCSPGWRGTNKRFKNLTGQKFGRLTVKYHYGKNKHSHNLWYCECECGGHAIVDTNALRSGDTKSCGCLAKELTIKRSTTHGKTKHKLYRIYAHMKERCYSENSQDYEYYGGRGIKICDEWLLDFENFYQWAINSGYTEGLTIDRIDVNGNYEPSNCRWTTMKKQNNNKRSNIIIEFDGKAHTLKEWSEILGIKYNTLYTRVVMRGWTIEKAFTSKVRKRD